MNEVDPIENLKLFNHFPLLYFIHRKPKWTGDHPLCFDDNQVSELASIFDDCGPRFNNRSRLLTFCHSVGQANALLKRQQLDSEDIAQPAEAIYDFFTKHVAPTCDGTDANLYECSDAFHHWLINLREYANGLSRQAEELADDRLIKRLARRNLRTDN
jgi:hypothetical protein